MNETRSEKRRIYLDHAATSWPKSESVYAAMDKFARECGATAGRGGYQHAVVANSIVAQARHAIAVLVGAESDECISFHDGGTGALNAAIHGMLRPGDHVVTTAAEHNSVLRPIHHWQQRYDVEVTVVPTDNGGLVDADQLINAVNDRTRLVALTSASNVTGAVQPIAEVGRALANHQSFFLCDAAQTFGVLPIDVRQCHIDALAAPGHKSSGGPAGTGFLYLSKRCHNEVIPVTQGGTGNQSESLSMPSTMPAMMEAGNLNVPAIAGWLEALKELNPEEMHRRAARAAKMAERLHDSLRGVRGIKLFASGSTLPIASLSSDMYEPDDLSAILDAELGIETRSGLHCAALIHDCIGSGIAGTLRISAGHDTSQSDIEAVVAALTQIMHAGD